MKIAVIGGSGLIGTHLIEVLRESGHEGIAVSRTSGVNVLTGEGLDQALTGVDVVVDVLNSPSFEPEAVWNFFDTSSRCLVEAEKRAGVRHHVALSIVGVDRTENAYFKAKRRQEFLIQESGLPFTIVRATQFFEFLGWLVTAATSDGVVHASNALMQPIAARDVAQFLGKVAASEPKNQIVDLAGPEALTIAALFQRALTHSGRSDTIILDETPTYVGATLGLRDLIPAGPAEIAPTHLADWFRQLPT